MELFDKRKALNYILDVAYEKSISQAKLIEGIYDYSHFNRMCNGKETIKLEGLLLCAQKLHIDLNKLVSKTYDTPAEKLSSLKEEFKWLTLKRDYHHLDSFYISIQHICSDNVIFKQFKKRVEGIICGEIHHNYPKALSLLFEALEYTIQTKDINDIDFSKLSNDEIDIIDDIAICYNFLGEKRGITLLENLIHSLEINSNIQDYISLYYNLSSLYSTFQKYEEKKAIATRGIQLALQYNDFITLSYLYYSRFIANICLGNEQEALRDYHDCHSLMEVQNRLDFLYQILEEDKNFYNIPDSLLPKE